MDISKIKFWGLKGGGVCGQAYIGAAKAATTLGMYQRLEGVAGSSAGAITAMCICLKYTAAELYDIWTKVDYKSFKDGFNPVSALTTYGIYKGEVLFSFIKTQIKNKTGNELITFGDLKRLGYLDLVVYACDHDTAALVKFSAELTPNTIVAEAVSASAAIPEYFRRRKLTAGEYAGHHFIDAGVMYNYPIDAFPDNVLGLFLYDVKTKAVYDPIPENEPVKAIERTVLMLASAQDVGVLNNPDIMKKTIVIDTKVISSTNFDITPQESQRLITSGELALLNYFKK